MATLKVPFTDIRRTWPLVLQVLSTISPRVVSPCFTTGLGLSSED